APHDEDPHGRSRLPNIIGSRFAPPREGPGAGRLPAVRAARFVGPGVPIELREVPDPAPGPNEIVVRVEACGICASDLHFIHGEMPLPVPPPLTMGHEASGTIAAVGSEVPGWREGAWGVGGLGTHAVPVGLLAGASFVVAVDPLAEARERAVALGADLALDPSKDDVTNAIRDATGGRGLDLAVDAVGRAE